MLVGFRMLLGVKPVPLIETPNVIGVPAITLDAPRAIFGVANIIRSALAELPAASVTTMRSAVEVSVEGTTNPTEWPVYKVPLSSVWTGVPCGRAAGVLPPTFSHVVAVPLTVSVCGESLAKPTPVMATAWPGLTAGSEFSFGVMVNVVCAYAPVEPWTVIVCVPAVVLVGSSMPERRSMPPFVLATVRPTMLVGVAEIGMLSNLTVSVSLALNPAPVIAIVILPPVEVVGALVVGVTWICDAATVKLVVAVFTVSSTDKE